MNLEMQNITKEFGPVIALSDVNFRLGQGEIHGLLGENGAGKTTLMNVLAGTFPPTGGKIFIDGTEITDMTPQKSMDLKIRFIHQELNLCNDLTVYENMFLGEEITGRAGVVDKKAEIKRAQEVLDSMNAAVDARSVVSEIETAKKQLVEIAKALLFQSELIIMDEPTTALNNQEIENLFAIMRRLQAQGVSFIYISHKMPEIFAVCDKYTVLRDGKFIDTGLIKDIDEHKATELLIGKTFVDANLKEQQKPGVKEEVLLSVKNLTGESFEDISFDLHKGEVIAVTGLQGAGSAELATALFGITSVKGGTVETKNGVIHGRSILHVMKNGIAMIPCNRKERGILPDLSIRDNNSMSYFTLLHKKLVISNQEEKQRFEKNRAKMEIKAESETDPITSLSGGNQQKVIVGRWLETDADILIMDNPTQGIDVGAKYSIYKLILDLASKGKGILVFSTEFPEIYQIADRCLVMYKGRLRGILNREEMDEAQVMALSTGTKMEVLK
ncbi:MAG: sugar ABC transporter ATP-binding protein [Lacrimispora sp.]|uniref:sugar ABC transporter ATP-binding protein n=1 Tax=Lacrimispora sp. TaxID=2719234 RepID=UPI0039E72834